MNKHLSPDVDFRLVPLGATPTKEGCYFAVWSPNARSIVIHIFNRQEKELYKVFSGVTQMDYTFILDGTTEKVRIK